MAQISLHESAQSELRAAVAAFSRAVTAWRGVSSAGASRTVSVANVLVTLRDASFDPANSAPGILGGMVLDAEDALNWLKDSTAKLARILRGLENQRNAIVQRIPEEGSRPILATLSCERWSKLLAEGMNCLRLDLEDKLWFIEMVGSMVDGTAVVDAEILERGAETWLEMPRVDSSTVDLVQASFEAEKAAGDSLQFLDANRQADNRRPPASPPPASGTSHSASVSPAMAFLLGDGNAKCKGKTK